MDHGRDGLGAVDELDDIVTGIAVGHGAPGDDVVELVDRAKAIAAMIHVEVQVHAQP